MGLVNLVAQYYFPSICLSSLHLCSPLYLSILLRSAITSQALLAWQASTIYTPLPSILLGWIPEKRGVNVPVCQEAGNQTNPSATCQHTLPALIACWTRIDQNRYVRYRRLYTLPALIACWTRGDTNSKNRYIRDRRLYTLPALIACWTRRDHNRYIRDRRLYTLPASIV